VGLTEGNETTNSQPLDEASIGATEVVVEEGREAGSATPVENVETYTSTTPEPPPPVWITPAQGIVSSPAGNRTNPVTGNREFHDGIDIALPIGTAIFAPKDGTVISVAYIRGYGNTLRIQHIDGYITFFAHLQRAAAAVGDVVTQGQQVAYSGNTGMTTGPHLHFGMFRNGEFVDPLTRISM